VSDQNNERIRRLELVRIATNGVLNRASLAPGHVDLASPLFCLGRLLMNTGRAVEAEPLLVEAVSVRKTHLPAGHKDLQETERLLAECRRKSREVEK